MARRAAFPHDRDRAKHCGERRHVATEHSGSDPAPLRSRARTRGPNLGRCSQHHDARRRHRGRRGVAHAALRSAARAIRASFCVRGWMATAHALLRAHRAHPLATSADFYLLCDKRHLGAARLGCAAALADRAALRFHAGRRDRCARALGHDADELRLLLGADRGLRARCGACSSRRVAGGCRVGRACARGLLFLRACCDRGDTWKDARERPNGDRRRGCAATASGNVGNRALCDWIVCVGGARRANSGGYERLRGSPDVWVARKSRCARGTGAKLLFGDRWVACGFCGVSFCRIFAYRAALLGIGRRRFRNAANAVAARRNRAQSRDHGRESHRRTARCRRLRSSGDRDDLVRDLSDSALFVVDLDVELGAQSLTECLPRFFAGGEPLGFPRLPLFPAQ